MELVTMGEAAQRMGVSVDTVRRRLRRGELLGRHQPTPQGFIWLVELPDQTGSQSGAGDVCAMPPAAHSGVPGDLLPNEGDVHALRELVEVLRHEIDTRDKQMDSKDRQIEQLHVLLQQAQSGSAPNARHGTSQIELGQAN